MFQENRDKQVRSFLELEGTHNTQTQTHTHTLKEILTKQLILKFILIKQGFIVKQKNMYSLNIFFFFLLSK